MTSPTSLNFPPDRTAWFHEARFGLFVHWGLYSILGRGEWIMNREQIPFEEYRKLADQFTAEGYNPREWAAIAKEAGMRYAVLTTKHHEGFCLWDSATCSFNSVNSAARRDLVREFVEAFREAGLKVGLYYSLGDWSHPGWFAGWKGDIAAREEFMDYTHRLVRELMTGYGKIDVLWYDLPQNYTAGEWRTVELNAQVRQWQPHILINNRGLTTEDLATPEQHVSASRRGRLWEACMTLNESWGFVESDVNYKTSRQVVNTLASAAASCGNLLLNVGPTAEGRFPSRSVDVLKEVGEWLRTHGEAVYGSEPHNLPWNLWGSSSRRGQFLYLLLNRIYASEIVIGGLQNRVLSATLLGGPELSARHEGNRWILSGLPAIPPNPLLPVIRVEVEGEPRQNLSEILGGADIFAEFPA